MAVGHKHHEAVDGLVLEPVEVTGRVPVTEVARPAAQISAPTRSLLDTSDLDASINLVLRARANTRSGA